MNILQKIKDLFTIHIPEYKEPWEDYDANGDITIIAPDYKRWSGIKGDHEYMCGRCEPHKGFKTHRGLESHRSQVHKRKK